uniref:DUF1768 domain-containing protein n=1 Tax=Heterorhabditis bacteriophora TaxID=37862 RepID=A0A1I7WU64_HETBA
MIDKRKQSMGTSFIQDTDRSESLLRKSIEFPSEAQSNSSEVVLDFTSKEHSHMKDVDNSEVSAPDEVYVTNTPDRLDSVTVKRRLIKLSRSERPIEVEFKHDTLKFITKVVHYLSFNNRFALLPVITSKVPNEKIIAFFMNKHVLSNQFICKRLVINGLHFNCTTQFYTWKKAKIAENEGAAIAILHLKDPNLMKEVGRELGEKFDAKGWRRCSWRLMLKANMAKYKQNRALRFELFRTIGATLVEADEMNTWWGVGMGIADDIGASSFSNFFSCHSFHFSFSTHFRFGFLFIIFHK